MSKGAWIYLNSTTHMWGLIAIQTFHEHINIKRKKRRYDSYNVTTVNYSVTSSSSWSNYMFSSKMDIHIMRIRGISKRTH